MKQDNKNKSNFKKGSVEMLLLHLLKNEGDCYGYQLSQMILEKSNGILVIPEGSMYPTLYKMIDSKYISDYKKVVGKRMTRVYYHLEPLGEEKLNELIKDYLEVAGAIESIMQFSIMGADGFAKAN